MRVLKRGVTVVTTCGFFEEVIHFIESLKVGLPVKSMDVLVTMKSGESRLIVERCSIDKVTTPDAQSES